MKKFNIGMFVAFLLLMIASIYTPSTSNIDDPGSRYCRCKQQECNAGNKISFRPICMDGGGECHKMDSNC